MTDHQFLDNPILLFLEWGIIPRRNFFSFNFVIFRLAHAGCTETHKNTHDKMASGGEKKNFFFLNCYVLSGGGRVVEFLATSVNNQIVWW